MKGKIAVTFLVGAGIGLTGCQGPMMGGLPWGRSSAASSTAPDVGGQKFSELSKQFGGDQSRAMGKSQAEVGALGGARESSDGFFAASWKKTTAAVSGTMATKSVVSAPEDDPLRLDRMPKKIGPDVYVAAARLFENSSKFAEAEGKYHEALQAAPNHLNALVGLARLYDRQGQPQRAIEVYQKAIQAHPTSALAYNDLGLCFRRQRQLDKSVVALKKAVELNEENAKYRNNLAAALVDAGRPGEAYEQFAVVNAPAVAHYNVAYMLQQKGQSAEATQHLQQALKHDASLAVAREALAHITGETDAARATTEPPAAQSLANAAQPALRASVQTVREPVAHYAAGAADQKLYTAAPQVEAAATAEASSFHHVSDDAAPAAAEVAQRPQWSSAWAMPKSGTSGSQPLPPTD